MRAVRGGRPPGTGRPPARSPPPWCGGRRPIRSSRSWIRVDWVGFSKAAVETAAPHSAIVTITAEQNTAVRRAFETLAMDPKTVWAPDTDATGEVSAPRWPRPPTASQRVTGASSCAGSARIEAVAALSHLILAVRQQGADLDRTASGGAASRSRPVCGGRLRFLGKSHGPQRADCRRRPRRPPLGVPTQSRPPSTPRR